MTDYISELEERCEQLQSKLAEAQSKMPVWIDTTSTETHISCTYMLCDKVFGFVEHDTKYKTKVYGKTILSTFEANTVGEIKRAIEKEFLSIFLYTNMKEPV